MESSCFAIVIVDNDEDHLCYLTALLRQAGYHCVAFPRPQAAIEYIAKNPVALVITEVVMPDLDGIEVMRAVKTSFPEVPVVALCGAQGRDLYLHLMHQLGASATFTKPIALPAVLGVIEHSVRKRPHDDRQLKLPIEEIFECGIFANKDEWNVGC